MAEEDSSQKIENGITHIAEAGKSLVKGLKSLGVFEKIAKLKRNKKTVEPGDGQEAKSQ